MINDVLLTPEIVMTLSARVCEGQSRVAALPGDSPSLASFTSRVYDAFTDGDYTSSPAWTVESGTWSAASGALVPMPQSGARAISTANTYGNADIWYAFKRTGTGGWLDNSMVQLRYVDENNWLGVRWAWGMLIVVEKVNGVEQDLAYTAMAGDIQSIGNHVAAIGTLVAQQAWGNTKFSIYGEDDLREILELVKRNFTDASCLMDQFNVETVKDVFGREETIDVRVKEALENHLKRFHQRECTPEAGPIFVEMLGHLERISDLCNNIAEHVWDIQ